MDKILGAGEGVEKGQGLISERNGELPLWETSLKSRRLDDGTYQPQDLGKFLSFFSGSCDGFLLWTATLITLDSHIFQLIWSL